MLCPMCAHQILHMVGAAVAVASRQLSIELLRASLEIPARISVSDKYNRLCLRTPVSGEQYLSENALFLHF